MAAMTTVLTEFGVSADSKQYTTSGHLAQKPRLVIQKRRVPAGPGSVGSMTTTIIRGVVDSAGANIAQRVSMAVEVRVPYDIGAADTGVADALAILKDIVNGDEFAAGISSQNFLKA